MSPNPSLFAALLIASLALFCLSCYRRFSLLSLGKPEWRSGDGVLRLASLARYAFGQRRVLARPFGVNHVVIFWSFLILLVANAEFLLSGIFPALTLGFLPAPLHHALLCTFDLVSLAVLGAVLVASCRRVISPPFEGARTPEAFAILGMIALLMLAYFGLHGAEIALGREPAAASMPVSAAAALHLSRVAGGALAALPALFWWLHAVVLLVFLNYLPHSKHMHILTALPNIYWSSLTPANTQPRERFAKGESYGAGSVAELSWKDLLDSFSCTECGRCQDACPAASTGKELSPRRLIHDIKLNLLENGSLLRAGNHAPLVGEGEGRLPEEAVWSCTTCGSCLQVCPVLIEQMPKLVKLRRHLVQMKAKFPEELLNLFENMEGRSNPWGIAPSERGKWSSAMKVKPFASGETEYLFYVGCAGAFDSRQKQVSVALATILDQAGVSWGVLGKDELCCGDSVRRLGNEYLFDRMARRNVKLLEERGVQKIVTHCPHCFTTLKNDYRQFGLEIEVLHHSELIASLIAAGRLPMKRQAELGTVAIHDSCYLGRHNGVYDAPRNAVVAATGRVPLELGRNRDASFCCGAGGGRMWMEEQSGTRINGNRIDEALAQSPDTVCVSCPYCMTMLEDALKERGAQDVRVRDVAELVCEGLRP